jgi:hypothetical protein
MTESALMDRTERLESPIYGEIMPVAAIQQNIGRVQLLKKEVLKEGIDFGTIPGTPKPSLYKPGAEMVNLMFGVSVDPDPASLREEIGVDELGVAFYTVTVRMVLKTRTGMFLGASYGSASSLEEKYKWRRATGPKEFAATPEGRKRTKYKRGKNGTEYEELQVRTEVEDIKNTILQMAMKRAEVSGTKRVHALSGMFGQDLEDLPEEIRDSIVDGEVVSRDGEKPPTAGQRKSQQGAGGDAKSGASAGAAAAATETDSGGGTKSPTGKVAKVEDKTTKTGKAYYGVRLNTGFACTTWSKTLADDARAHAAGGRVVELVTEVKDPKFPPTLTAIKVVGGDRDPGQEG